MRKPIQIAALRFVRPDDKGGEPINETEVVALCDDGSIWTMFGMESAWVPLPQIPQVPLRDDWLDEVGQILIKSHLMKKESIREILSEHEDLLRAAFNRHETAKQAAAAVSSIVSKTA